VEEGLLGHTNAIAYADHEEPHLRAEVVVASPVEGDDTTKYDFSKRCHILQWNSPQFQSDQLGDFLG
jgi:hypothetical protein